MADNSSLSRSAFAEILAHLRSLRASLTKARDALVHFKDDRVDRDRLEPAARRVDELMNLFATGSHAMADTSSKARRPRLSARSSSSTVR